MKIRSAINTHYQQILELQVDKGEASSIALDIESDFCTLIVDDYRARKLATELGIKITGTLGVLVKAKLNGSIESVTPYLEKIRRTNFRLSNELLQQALFESGELE